MAIRAGTLAWSNAETNPESESRARFCRCVLAKPHFDTRLRHAENVALNDKTDAQCNAPDVGSVSSRVFQKARQTGAEKKDYYFLAFLLFFLPFFAALAGAAAVAVAVYGLTASRTNLVVFGFRS